MDLCAGRPAVLLQPQPQPPPFFSFFSHVQLSPCSSPRLAEISDCGEKPNSGLESHSSPIWCHPPTPKAKYGSNLPRERTLFRSRTLQAARGNSRFSRLPITSVETGEREKIEEKLRGEDVRVGKESLSGFRGFIPTLLK